MHRISPSNGTRRSSDDRKSLDLLTSHLNKIKAEAMAPKPSKKQPTRQPPKKRRPQLPIKKRSPKKPPSTPNAKITDFFRNENILAPSTSETDSPPPAKAKRGRKAALSESFERYGLAMPTFEQMLASKAQSELHERQTEALSRLDCNSLERKLALPEPRAPKIDKFDCKGLAHEALEARFGAQRARLQRLLAEGVYARLARRMARRDVCKDSGTLSSLMVFSNEQKMFLVDLLAREFDADDTKRDYLFRVLLPKLCLLIFMDEYGMSKRDALGYMEKYVLLT